MLKSETTTINGTGYQVTQLPYKTGQRLLIRLYKALGPALADALTSIPDIAKETNLLDMSWADIAPALHKLVSGVAQTLNEEDFDFMVDSLAEYTQVKTADKWVPIQPIMELHFSGNYEELFRWIAFGLKTNYAGFLKGRGLADVLQNTKAGGRANLSQVTSTGPSTE